MVQIEERLAFVLVISNLDVFSYIICTHFISITA